jgi:hypothetical protein
MNTDEVLKRLNLDSPLGESKVVQNIREQIEGSPNPLSAAKVLFSNFTLPEQEFNFTDANEARLTIVCLVVDAMKLGEQYDPTEALKRSVEWIANHKEKNPWSFIKPESGIETETVHREGVNVEVKTDGKLKKGSKQILAKAIFEKDPSLSNKDMIKLFVKELNMTEAGARTYVYNCRKDAK